MRSSTTTRDPVALLLLWTLRINLFEQSNRFRNADHRLGITAEMMRKLNINKVSSISQQPANNGPRSIVSIWFAGNNGEESLIIQLFPTHYPRMRARILWFSGQESRDFGRRSLTWRHLLCRGLVVLILRLSLDPHLEGEELGLLSPLADSSTSGCEPPLFIFLSRFICSTPRIAGRELFSLFVRQQWHGIEYNYQVPMKFISHNNEEWPIDGIS